jgi:hypothetical protein
MVSACQHGNYDTSSQKGSMENRPPTIIASKFVSPLQNILRQLYLWMTNINKKVKRKNKKTIG